MRIQYLLGLLSAGVLLTAGTAFADDVTDQIQAGIEQYKQGNLNQALKELDFASAMINEKLQAQLNAEVFPEPLPGWQAEEASGVAMGAFMGGGASSMREYTKGNSRVSITILIDSPAIAGMAMMLSNPMIATAEPGVSLVKVKGEKARKRFEDGSGELSLILDNRVMITIEGYGMDSEEPLMAYANAVNFDKVRASIKD